MRVLIVGVSTRAVAESAARAGFDTIALDAYADLDQHPSVHALSLPRDFGAAFSPEATVAAARELPGDAVVYLSSFENHPKAVEALMSGRALWGNAPGVLRLVRDPKRLAAAFAKHGIRVPRVITHDASTSPPQDVERWMIKPRVSGGGHGVRLRGEGEPLARSHYLQEFVDGVSGSVVFVSARGRGVALGTSSQLVGDEAFGVSGFRYCGNILNLGPGEDLARAAATLLVDAISEEFSLVGVGSIDFVATESALQPVEVNPRWSASMELVERARGVSMFAMHAAACTTGVLPPLDLLQAQAATGSYGKAIVFAREDVILGDTREWLDDLTVRDIPREGERIAAGQPICTVFASGADEATCYSLLVERAARIYAALS